MTKAYLTDTHCHLNLNTFVDDLPVIIERATDQDVHRILVPGIDLPTSRLAVELADRYPMIYAAVGVHPGHSESWNDHSLSELRELAAHPKTVAIGEIGLDFFRDHAPREHQRSVFSVQLELAAERNLPVVLHNRDSFQDLWLILTGWLEQLSNSQSPLVQHPGVFHSYDGDLVSALEAVKHGFLIGVSGPVTFKNAVDRQQVVAGLPLDHILIETDAPYLTPSPHRGKWPNEPAFTVFIAEKVAALHNQSIDNVRKATAENAARLFAWEL